MSRLDHIKSLYLEEARRFCPNVTPDWDEGIPAGGWKNVIEKGIPSWSATDGSIAEAFLEMDKDKDGKLTFREFKTQMSKPKLDTSKKQECEALIKSKWDKNGDSMLSKSEMQEIMKDYRPETLERVMTKADTDGDGQISVNEFYKEVFGQ